MVVDDCATNNLGKEKNLKWIFNNGRHRKILFMLCLQFMLSVPPVLRVNIDYVFLLREPNRDNQKRLYEYYAKSIFPTLELFVQCLEQMTNNYGIMILDNTVSSSEITERCFYYKAKIRDDFKIGCSKYWEYNKKHFNKQHNVPKDLQVDIRNLSNGKKYQKDLKVDIDIV